MSVAWERLLGLPEFGGPKSSLPTSGIAAMFTLACLLCLAMLHARIRAREVVRG
jgi:hypothetical protein